MTSTYTAEKNPWRVDGSLQKRLNTEAEARSLAGNAIDMLGIVSVYAGRDWEGVTHSGSKSLFPGRALVTKRSDPARKVRLPHVPANHSSRMRPMMMAMTNDEQQQEVFYQNNNGDNNDHHQQYLQQQQEQEEYNNNNNYQIPMTENGDQEQVVGFNEQFNREYFSNGRRRFNQYDFPDQQHQQQQNTLGENFRNEQHFQYANMDELDLLNGANQHQQQQGINNNNYNMTSFDDSSRQISSIQANSRQNSAFNRQVSQIQQQQQQQQQQNSNNSGRNSPTHEEAYEQQIRVREEQRQQKFAEMSQDQLREMQENDEISRLHGLYSKNSFKDIRLSRECKYGTGSRTLGDDDRHDETRHQRERRISREQQQQQHQQQEYDDNSNETTPFLSEEEIRELDNASPATKRRKMREIAKRKMFQRIAAPEPLNPRDYPVQRTTSRSTVHDKPLVYCEGSGAFVCAGDAYGSFPSSAAKSSEIHQRMLDRKNGRSVALHKAIEEIKYNDRALLVNLPWQVTNHKSNQVYFMGGGNTPVAKFDFLEKNAVRK